MLPVILFNVLTVHGGLVAKTGNELDSRILYGDAARIVDHPYFAALPGLCGAAIISESWLVTAAHCVDPMPADLVWVGGDRIETSQFYKFDKVVIHPEYKKIMSVPVNDIALLRLSRPLRFSNTVQAVALPETEYETHGVYTFVGKGQDETEQMARYLSAMEVRTLNENECISHVHPLLQMFLQPYLDQFRKVTICTERNEDRYHSQGVCHGDNGSPLVDENTLVGIASFISDTSCSNANLALFTNVAPFVGWIKEVTGIEGKLEEVTTETPKDSWDYTDEEISKWDY